MFRLYIFFAMDTEFLEIFVKVVEHGSVAEAARRLNLTVAAVTQRLRALEREIGTALVSRSVRNMRATEAGVAILAQSEQLLRSVRDLRTTANEQNFAGELSLRAISSALTCILPPILSRLAEDYPAITLHIYPGTSSELYRKATDGELDAAVIVEPQFALPKTCNWVTCPRPRRYSVPPHANGARAIYRHAGRRESFEYTENKNRNRKTHRCRKRFCRASQALGGGANHRLVQSLPPSGQGLGVPE